MARLVRGARTRRWLTMHWQDVLDLLHRYRDAVKDARPALLVGVAAAIALALWVRAPARPPLGRTTRAVVLGVLLSRMSRRLAPELPQAFGVVPLACVLLAANYTWASFTTGGLETMLGAMLATLALERATSERPFAAGLAGIGAAMSHPDHAI